MNSFIYKSSLFVCVLINLMTVATIAANNSSNPIEFNSLNKANGSVKTKSTLINLLKEINYNKTIKTTHEQLKNQTKQSIERKKRQLAFAGGLGLGFGAYDYNDYYGDYVSDYAYDYYDWVCSEQICQLCDILTSECCDPDRDVNCFLPDSCLNNPCLSGGTCITTRTLDNRPDFVCICLPGLTGKYCQLVNDYFVGAEFLLPPVLPPIPPVPGPAPAPAASPSPAPTASPAPAPTASPAPLIQPQPQATQYYPTAKPYQQYQAPSQAQSAYMNQAVAPYQSNNYPKNLVSSSAETDGRYIPKGSAPSPYYQQPAQQQQQRVRTLGAKSIKCDDGKIWSSVDGACVDFALKKTTTKK